MAAFEKPELQLSRVIDGHKSDVKAIQSTSEGLIISGGRDEVVRFWAKKAGEFVEVIEYRQERGLFVNSLGYYEGDGDWRLFVGRKDGSISVYGPGSSAEKPLHTLVLHEQNVSCIFVDEKQGLIMTGSWDRTAVVMSVKELSEDLSQVRRLIGHTMTVLAVHTLPEPNLYLTAGSDRVIRLWKEKTEVRQFTGHEDVVRALVVLPNNRFLSASNDATIRLWDTGSGNSLGKFTSLQDQFIYSINIVGDKLVTTSEGGYIELWEAHEDQKRWQTCQIIRTPAQALWDSSIMANGDIAAAGSDGRIYVWTFNEKRKAPDAIIEAFDSTVAAQVAKESEQKERQSGETVVIKVALDDGPPTIELRYVKGTDPAIAAEKFIKDNNLPISYLSEITEYIKVSIPEARAAAAAKMKPQETQRVTVDGQKWDYVFDISADDGRKLQLCYNAGEDTDMAAQRFVEKHNLPMKFLGQVSTFLRSQMSEAGVTSSYKDPFTGGSSYAPEKTDFQGTVADPFTGEGRYIPSGATPMDTSSSDPFTSGGRYIPGSGGATGPKSSMPLDKTRPQSDYCPLKQYYFFGVEQLSQKAKDKLKEINANQTCFQLNDAQLGSLEELMSSQPNSIEITDTLISAIDMGLNWNIQEILPIVDVFRIALLHEKLNSTYCDVNKRGKEVHQRLTSLLVSDPPDAVSAVLCRVIANAFSHKWGQEMLMLDLGITTGVISQRVLHAKPVVQLAASTALANWSHLLLIRSEKISELGPREDLLRAIIKAFESVDSFGGRSEMALVRVMQAIATLMWGDATIIKLARQRNLANIINKIKDGVVEEASKALARDIIEMINCV